MTIESKYLLYSVILCLVQIILASHSASLQRGYRWTASARDEPTVPLTGLAGRLERALRNFLETFPLYAAVVLLSHALDQHSSMTMWGSQLYFWGRVAFLGLYAAGVPVVRSLAWNVATAGIFLFVIALIRAA